MLSECFDALCSKIMWTKSVKQKYTGCPEPHSTPPSYHKKFINSYDHMVCAQIKYTSLLATGGLLVINGMLLKEAGKTGTAIWSMGNFMGSQGYL